MQSHLEVTVNSVMELTRHYASDLSQTADAIYHRWLSVSRSIRR
jgi:hypothetical protein